MDAEIEALEEELKQLEELLRVPSCGATGGVRWYGLPLDRLEGRRVLSMDYVGLNCCKLIFHIMYNMYITLYMIRWGCMMLSD